jgi:hypothetical protein
MGLQLPAADQAGPLNSFLEAEFERLGAVAVLVARVIPLPAAKHVVSLRARQYPPEGKDERGGFGALIV